MLTRAEILDGLRLVEDPEIGMNVVDLGLVYGVDVDQEKGHVRVELTLTSPGCPLGPEIVRNIQRELSAMDHVLDVEVMLVWNPLWSPRMMSDAAKDELGYDDEFGLGFGS